MSVSANTRSKKPSVGLLARGAWRTAHVVFCRRFGLRPRYLPVLLLFVSGRCNLRCRMCGVCEPMSEAVPEPELTTDEWRGVIDSAAHIGVTLVSISGGEPLLRKDLPDIARHAVEAGMAVHLCTNAVLMTEHWAACLRDAGVRTISISIESPDAATHEMLRGANTFLPAVNAVRLLRRTAPDIRIGLNYLITRVNYTHMCDMVAFAESLDVHQLKFAPIHTNLLHRHKAPNEFAELMFDARDVEALEIEVRKVQAACTKSRLLTTSPDFFAGIGRLYANPRKFRCFAGYAAVAVGPTGEVAPCCDMDSPYCVRRRPLDAIWRDPEFHALRKKVHHCAAACWDTTNTEMSLRLRPWKLAMELLHNWRDIRFYLGGRP